MIRTLFLLLGRAARWTARAIKRSSIRVWRSGIELPFPLLYALALVAGGALLWLQYELARNGVDAAAVQLGLTLATVSLLAALVFQARALVRTKVDKDVVFHRNQYLCTAFTELQQEQQQRHTRLEELSIIRELGLAINSILDFNRLLRTSTKLIADTVEAGGYFLFLRDNAGKTRFQLAVRGGTPLAEENPLIAQLEKQYLQPAVEGGRPLLVDDRRFGPFLFVPLRDSETQLGLFGLFEPKKGQFSRENLDLLAIVGKHLAVALKNALLYDLAITDGMTGLYTKRHFSHRLQQEVDAARRYGRALSLVMIDIDHFKKFNDTYGHLMGDRVLIAVADLVKQALRTTDSAFRYGGEELSVLLVETPVAEARNVAERIRQRIRDYQLTCDQGVLRVTVSLGVAEWNPAMSEPNALIKVADDALYAAKESGRDRTVVGALPAPTAPRPAPIGGVRPQVC